MDPVDQQRNVSVGNLDLPPGYYAERGETGVYLMDPDGRRVMRFSSEVALAEDPRETGRLKPSAKPQPEEWQELCRSLLTRLAQKSAECERLNASVAELGERLEAAEAERDQANAIAEDLYEFFRNRVRETVDRRERSGRRAPH
jgi:16S rRNA C967 or C1407 C5-methylase (RsmB/RsmF family)